MISLSDFVPTSGETVAYRFELLTRVGEDAVMSSVCDTWHPYVVMVRAVQLSQKKQFYFNIMVHAGCSSAYKCFIEACESDLYEDGEKVTVCDVIGHSVNIRNIEMISPDVAKSTMLDHIGLYFDIETHLVNQRIKEGTDEAVKEALDDMRNEAELQADYYEETINPR